MKEYSILNRKLVIDDAAERYYTLRARFNIEAEKVASKYDEKFASYRSNRAKITTVLDNYFDDIKECADYLVDEMLAKLRANDIYDKTKDSMYKTIGDFGKDDTAGYKNVYIKVSAATAYHDVKESQNQAESEGHGTWEGGGFGLEGAIKGAATAEALNLATDLLFDGIKEIKNSQNDKLLSSNLDRIMNDPETIENLKESARDYVDRLFEVCLPLYGEFDGAYVSTVEEEKSKGLFESAQSVPEKREELLFRALEANLLDENLYRVIIDEYNDENNELEKVAIELAGINLHKYKVMKVEEFICTQNYIVGFDAEKCINDIKEMSSKLGVDVTEYLNVIAEIENVIKKSDLVVDGMTYGTPEEAKKAKDEIDVFVDKFSKMDVFTEESVIALRDELTSSTILSKDKYIDTLNGALDECDKCEKTFAGIEYDSREIAEEAKNFAYDCADILSVDSSSREEQQEKYEKIDALTSRKELKEEALKFVENTVKAIDELEACICNVSADMPRIELNKIVNNATRMKEKYADAGFSSKKFIEWYNKLDEDYRTVFGVGYNSYILADNEYYNCIEKANKYVAYLEKKEASSTAKKSLFSGLKEALGDAVQTDNQKAYNRVTQEGKVEIPIVGAEDKQKANEMDKETVNFVKSTPSEFVEQYVKLTKKESKDTYKFDIKMDEVIPAGIDKKAIRELVNDVCQYTVVGLKVADKKTIVNETIFEKIAGTITHAFKEESGVVTLWVELEDGELSKYSEINVGDDLCKLCIFAIEDVGDNMRIITTDYTKDVADLKGQVFRRAK